MPLPGAQAQSQTSGEETVKEPSILLKTQYKHILFVKVSERPRTSVWSCRNNRNNGELGVIRWYSGWRQYCYFPTGGSVYSMGCLNDIQTFVKCLAEENRRRR